MSDLRKAVAYTECSHGWNSRHCILDDEGSCPIPPKDWKTAECRCNESAFLNLIERPDGSWIVEEA